MALSWNEIKDRAIRFSREWEGESSEKAESRTFWDQFFDIFGVSRRKIASFEKPVKKLDDSTGYIDLLWKGTILVEHKSKGKNLDKAYKQAIDYFPGLAPYELPKYVLVSDFARFRLYNLDEDTHTEFELKVLYKNVKEFGFIAGYQKHVFREQDPVNVRAAELMGKLHDRLKTVGYQGHHLEVYLVRLLFCLFAEDTTIFERDQFRDYIGNKTRDDGSDLAQHLSYLFYVLNTPPEKRLTNLDEDLNAFPYVNGKLFEETLPPASFDRSMRDNLLECTGLDWGKISPAIFGSLFQSVMNPAERRNLGAHYTSEKNIMKVIRPLFLDDLWKEFETVKNNRNQLIRFHEKIASLRFLDPACGCGNFLVISYRELRLLELEILKQLQKGQQVFDITELLKLDVDHFYGIEIEEFPAQIAQVAMWLMDHQMNMRISEEFGQYFLRLPLRKSPNIHYANALQTDWHSLVAPVPWNHREPRFDYIFGNPPFVGKSLMNAAQKADMERVFTGVHGAGVLDFVTAWYLKAAKYLTAPHDPALAPVQTRCAFVSTNSIAQGEQVGVLWNELFNRYHLKIHFAHRTFKWSNEARGKAAVHVVIVGFAGFDIREKRIFEYHDINGEPHESTVSNINPYLVEGKDLIIMGRKKPMCSVPALIYGSKPVDDGNLFLTDTEKEQILLCNPNISKYIRPILSSHEFLHGKNRWCLWLENANPTDLSRMPEVMKRLENIRQFRLQSTKKTVNLQASTPAVFSEIRQPDSDYILIPRHSSENRKYIPIGFFDKDIIVSDSCTALPKSSLYHFGVLTSEMHQVWIHFVCGRLESRFRYSNEIVYNNFPWPENPTEKQRREVEEAVRKVLEVREKYLYPAPETTDATPGSSCSGSPVHPLTCSPVFPSACPPVRLSAGSSSLADLYDPLTMPPDLVKAHRELDRAVDLCYRPQPFPNETRRIEYLFELYDRYTAGLFVREKKGRS